MFERQPEGAAVVAPGSRTHFHPPKAERAAGSHYPRRTGHQRADTGKTRSAGAGSVRAQTLPHRRGPAATAAAPPLRAHRAGLDRRRTVLLASHSPIPVDAP
ncbi:hypothetical protein FRAHR75_360035 [Frankia sp. Hr75.2]|nr:hypothetical protein FRAHR75_360035 [Frankia sp. Hr75.2]